MCRSITRNAIGRWGGDEFVGVLANATDEAMQAASERIRSLVERSTIDIDGGTIRTTVSIGGALAGPDVSIEELLRQADRRVHTAKSNGRNRTAVAAA